MVLQILLKFGTVFWIFIDIFAVLCDCSVDIFIKSKAMQHTFSNTPFSIDFLLFDEISCGSPFPIWRDPHKFHPIIKCLKECVASIHFNITTLEFISLIHD